MSVCIIVKVAEGLVLSTDSASTVTGTPVLPNGETGPPGVLKIFFSGRKLFQLGKLPIGVMTWGAGSFRERSVASLIEEFENGDSIKQIQANGEVNIKKIANNLYSFMNDRSDNYFQETQEADRPKTGIALCGYTKDNFFPETYIMGIPGKELSQGRPDVEGQPNFGANWYGLTDAVNRFHHGRDDRLIKILQKVGVSTDKIKDINSIINRELQYPVLFNAMPLADAVLYAQFLVRMTIARFRFVVGAERCGGKIQTATITKKNGFEFKPEID